ncbi:MAG: DUF4391 domain-containing protein [bacterium]
MNAADIIAALEIPASARVDQRVPKKLVVEKRAPTAADKRRINEGIDEIQWVAALKPGTIGVAEYRDDVREYIEIAVLSVVLRPDAEPVRLTELLHRAVPYPAVVITEQTSRISVSLAHKRRSQGEADKVVVDGELVIGEIESARDGAFERPFLEALALVRQPAATLYSVYQGWMDVVSSLQVAKVTGSFAMAATTGGAQVRREALAQCAELETRMAALRGAAMRENQMARQVDLNLELKRLEAAHSTARARLEPKAI